MNLDDMKKGIDDFIKEIFYGITEYYILNSTTKRIEVTTKMLKMTQFKNEDRLEILYEKLEKYMKEENEDPKLIRDIYQLIMVARLTGIFVNNPDAITSLKIEKINAEDKSRKLENDNKLLSQEVVDQRSIIDSMRAKNPISG